MAVQICLRVIDIDTTVTPSGYRNNTIRPEKSYLLDYNLRFKKIGVHSCKDYTNMLAYGPAFL